jgi:hypothetical protein
MTERGHDRIPCINPRCRRTARADRYEPNTEIICGKCFRALPPDVKARRRQLEGRLRHVKRSVARRFAAMGIEVERSGTVRRVQIELNVQWDEIKCHLNSPERPMGLDGFLQEVGLA